MLVFVLLLSTLIFGTFQSINNVKECKFYKKDFMRQFEKVVAFAKLYQSLASRLSAKCHDVVNCSEMLNITFQKKEYSINFSSDICEVLDVYKGPLGACFDYIKYVYGSDNLMNCVLQENPTRGPSGSNCKSVFSNCSLSLIKEKCAPEVYGILEKNKKLFKQVNCSGVEHYEWMDWSAAVDMKKTKSYWDYVYFDYE